MDVGSRTGVQTRHAVEYFETVVSIDAVPQYLEELKMKFPTIRTECCLFETFESQNLFDTVIMVGFLEHVIDPVGILKKANELLTKNGRVLIGVPNGNSLHRQAGVAMGVLGSVCELTRNDIQIGHRRVYTWDTLISDLSKAGLACETIFGGFLKPLSSKQIQEDWTTDMIEAYKMLGRVHPQLSNFILCVAKRI